MVKGPGVTQELLYVVNRPGFDPVPYNRAAQERDPLEGRMPGQVPILYGPTLDYVAVTTRPIEGTVREAANGNPVAGVRILAPAGYNNGVDAVSDAQGRYRIAGLAKQQEYRLITEPGEKDPWLRRVVVVADTGGSGPLRADIELVRGLILTGRLIDRATGKGVPGGLRYVPLADNAYFGKRPGYDSYRFERLSYSTDAAGHFRLPVIPGSGVLLAQAHPPDGQTGGVALNPYRRAAFDPADRRRVGFQEDEAGRFRAAGNAIESVDLWNVGKVLDLAEDAGTVTCDLYVERGRTLTVNVQDADGRPLPGATAAGLTALWPLAVPLPAASFTVYALEPPKPRRLVLYHPGRQLAGLLTVRGDEKEPPVVRLAAAGAVTGRVLDADGAPVAGAEVGVVFADDVARELDRQLSQKRAPVRTDKAGHFRLEGLVPGVKFGLAIRQGRTFLVGEPRIGLKLVGAGEALDLGDIRTRPRP
jgi:protocatechuate 3,4-dioxygenase beta subunit